MTPSPQKFEFPSLSGPYGVGVTQRYIVTNSHERHQLSTKRELMVHIYYPAQIDKKSMIPYNTDAIADVGQIYKMFGVAAKNLSRLNAIYTHAVPDAPKLSHAQFPVIFFEHGYVGCLPTSYTALCEQIASHGYVVVATAHTYFASIVRFPDGRVVTTDPKKYTVSPHKMSEEQKIWVADAQSVLENMTLYNDNEDDFFYNYCDMNRLGVVGHSFGGTTAFLLCLQDTRFEVGIDLDGSIMADTPLTDISKPFMCMWAENTVQFFDKSDEEIAGEQSIENIRMFRKAFEATYYAKNKYIEQVTIPKLGHGGFSDRVILDELFEHNSKVVPADKNYLYFMATGDVDGRATVQLICKIIVDFLVKSGCMSK